jgi:hypothetical protein
MAHRAVAFAEQGAYSFDCDRMRAWGEVTMRFAKTMVAFAVAGGGYVSLGRAMPAPPADPVPHGMQSGFSLPLGGVDMLKLHEVTDREHLKAKEESGKLIKAIQLSCELADAALVGRGNAKTDGKTIEVSAYEVTCGNRMGYILVSQGPQPPIVVSCFAADAQRVAGVAKREKSDLYCQLAANKDVKGMAASLMTSAGTRCVVSDVRWFGLSASSRTDYSEVACADGAGFLLKIPQIGPSEAVSVMSCQEAAKQGMSCRLTDGGPVSMPVTMQTFRDALKQNDVNCEPLRMRMIGRESVAKRYVVEVQCQERPNGLVAFIPVAGNTGKFETLDCAAAIERQIRCELTPK